MADKDIWDWATANASNQLKPSYIDTGFGCGVANPFEMNWAIAQLAHMSKEALPVFLDNPIKGFAFGVDMRGDNATSLDYLSHVSSTIYGGSTNPAYFPVTSAPTSSTIINDAIITAAQMADKRPSDNAVILRLFARADLRFVDADDLSGIAHGGLNQENPRITPVITVKGGLSPIGGGGVVKRTHKVGWWIRGTGMNYDNVETIIPIRDDGTVLVDYAIHTRALADIVGKFSSTHRCMATIVGYCKVASV